MILDRSYSRKVCIAVFKVNVASAQPFSGVDPACLLNPEFANSFQRMNGAPYRHIHA
jgi:hypothetical protein